MQAVEFETQITNGVVRVPANFRNFQSAGKAKVVILLEDEEITSSSEEQMSFIERLTNNPVKLEKTSRFLSREEANER